MSGTPISRRNFLKITGITLGSATVLCSGLGYTATRSPHIDTPSLQFGEGNPQDKRVLVTYATRAGSTVEVAQVIAEVLGERGFYVDMRPAMEKPSVVGYRAVVAGSAVRMGSWLPEAVDFIKANQAALNRLAVFFYTVHTGNLGKDEKSRSNRLSYLDDVLPLVKTKDAVFFPGKIDLSRLSLLDRWMVGEEDKDLRDFQAIRAWAAGLENLL
jgi:menaquinone-dependent protoporphyrinogen oxidase